MNPYGEAIQNNIITASSRSDQHNAGTLSEINPEGLDHDGQCVCNDAVDGVTHVAWIHILCFTASSRTQVHSDTQQVHSAQEHNSPHTQGTNRS